MADSNTKNYNIIWLLLLMGGAYLIWNRNKKGKIAKLSAQKKSGGAGGGSSARPSGVVTDTLIAGTDGADININVATETESGEGSIIDNNEQAELEEQSQLDTAVQEVDSGIGSVDIQDTDQTDQMPPDMTTVERVSPSSPTPPVADIPQPQPVAQAGFVGFVDFKGDEDDLDIDY